MAREYAAPGPSGRSDFGLTMSAGSRLAWPPYARPVRTGLAHGELGSRESRRPAPIKGWLRNADKQVHMRWLFLVIVLSISAQLSAAFVAWSRQKAAGAFRLAWISISVALLFMVTRRVMELWQLYQGQRADAFNSFTGLVISLCMLYGMLGLRRLFDRLQGQEAELERQVRTDYLTGLLNRRAFCELGALEVQRAHRHPAPLSVLALDLDHFKRINDQHGHAAGDRVLKSLATTCRRMLRSIDLTGRLGGEEFAVLLPHTPLETALRVAERLRLAIAEGRMSLDSGQEVSVTVSIGVATWSPGDADLQALLNRADVALYAAKHAGRNQVVQA